MPVEIQTCLKRAATLPIDPTEQRPYVAVASLEGVLVNQHLGEATELSVFGRVEDGFAAIERRKTPSPGDGNGRWNRLAEMLHDCRALLVSSAGESPRSVLAARGIRVVMMEGLIEEGLHAVYGGHEIRAPLRRGHSCGSGSSCAGTGMGCM